MTVEDVTIILIIVLRFFCLVAYGLLALGALIGLVHKQLPKEMKQVHAFLFLLMTAIAYSSIMSVYTWLQNVEQWNVVASPFNSLILAIMFAVPGAFGLYIFRPWRIQ